MSFDDKPSVIAELQLDARVGITRHGGRSRWRVLVHAIEKGRRYARNTGGAVA